MNSECNKLYSALHQAFERRTQARQATFENSVVVRAAHERYANAKTEYKKNPSPETKKQYADAADDLDLACSCQMKLFNDWRGAEREIDSLLDRTRRLQKQTVKR